MVLSHDLQHMAPFGMLTIAFCMFFQGATLINSHPEARFLSSDQVDPSTPRRHLELGEGDDPPP